MLNNPFANLDSTDAVAMTTTPASARALGHIPADQLRKRKRISRPLFPGQRGISVLPIGAFQSADKLAM